MDDFEELIIYLQKTYSQQSAQNLIKAFDNLLDVLASFPFAYSEFSRFKAIRKAVLLRKTIVYYEVQGNVVTILSVRDGRRQNLGR